MFVSAACTNRNLRVQFFMRRAEISNLETAFDIATHTNWSSIELNFPPAISPRRRRRRRGGPSHLWQQNGKSACISPHRTLIQITYVWFNFLSSWHLASSNMGFRGRELREHWSMNLVLPGENGQGLKCFLSRSVPNQIWEARAAVKSDI